MYNALHSPSKILRKQKLGPISMETGQLVWEHSRPKYQLAPPQMSIFTSHLQNFVSLSLPCQQLHNSPHPSCAHQKQTSLQPKNAIIPGLTNPYVTLPAPMHGQPLMLSNLNSQLRSI